MNQREMTALMRDDDAFVLERAAAIVRRQKLSPDGMSRDAFVRVLLAEADALRAEARLLRRAS